MPYFEDYRLSLDRRYAATNTAAPTAIPRGGRSRSISGTFIRVILITLVIIMHAAFYRRFGSDLAKAVSILFYHWDLNPYQSALPSIHV